MATSRTFAYRTIDASGKRIKGKIDAVNAVLATQLLRQQGIVPISLTDAGSFLRKDIDIPGLSGRTTLKDLAVLVRQLAATTSAGMPLLRSLTVLEAQITKPALRKAIGEVRANIEGGSALSVALGRHPKIFPTLMVAMIRAGETGGFLDNALEQIAVNFEKDIALRSKIKGALTYPAIVLGFATLMISAVMIFIVPIFVRMFHELGSELPLPTRVLATISQNMLWVGPLLMVVFGGGTVLFRRIMRSEPTIRLRFDALKLRLPIFGKLFTKIAISRFARNLGTLLHAGVPVMQALDVVAGTIGNAVLADAMRVLKDAVRDGKPMSTPLGTYKIFPPMVTQMIEVGEESGQLSQMLGKVADYYDREVDSAAEALTASIEPIIVLLMGIVVAAMVVCLYLPIFTIYQHVQGAE